MDLGSWGMFFLKLIVLFAGVYVIIILTPKLAAFIDSHRKTGDRPDEPRPERVQSENDTENGENPAEALRQYVNAANQEITRKRTEFNMPTYSADANNGENSAEESENTITESINQSENKQE